jgi:hypothetical protein
MKLASFTDGSTLARTGRKCPLRDRCTPDGGAALRS